MKTEDKVAKWYDSVGEKCLRFFKQSQDNEIVLIKRVLGKLPKKASVLDAGCGKGKPVSKYLSNKGYKVIGIDISKRMIELAKKNVPKATIKRMSLTKMRFKNNKFDAIFCFFAILHLEKKKVVGLFKKFHRILKKKGYILFSVNKGKADNYQISFGKKTYFSAYTKKEMREILKKTRFKMVWQKDILFKKGKHKEHQMYYFVKRL